MELLQKIIGIIFLLITSFSRLNACSCDTISFNEAVNYADEIFFGKIIKAEKFNDGKYVLGNQERINWNWKFQFEVEKKWKGSNKKNLVVYHQGTSCDLWFNIYEEYLVYASKGGLLNLSSSVTKYQNESKKRLSTYLCSRTTSLDFLEEANWYQKDKYRLDKIFPNEILLNSSDSNWHFWCIITLVILLLFFIIKNSSIVLRKLKVSDTSPP